MLRIRGTWETKRVGQSAQPQSNSIAASRRLSLVRIVSRLFNHENQKTICVA